MLILLDVGNTSISYAVYRKAPSAGFAATFTPLPLSTRIGLSVLRRTIGRKGVGGDPLRTAKIGSFLKEHIPKFIKKCAKSGDKYGFDIVITSVVPKNTEIIKKYTQSFLRGRPFKIWIVGSNLHTKIRHRYQSKRLGADRAVNIFGAIRLYRPPLLMIDYGTAITADYISRNGVFEGGLIIPGPEIALQALIERAALLPKKIRLPKNHISFLGRNTYECLHSGTLQGYGALTDGLIERFRQRYGNLRVVATGGFASHIKPYTRHLRSHVDPGHTLKSLLLLYLEKANGAWLIRRR